MVKNNIESAWKLDRAERVKKKFSELFDALSDNRSNPRNILYITIKPEVSLKGLLHYSAYGGSKVGPKYYFLDPYKSNSELVDYYYNYRGYKFQKPLQDKLQKNGFLDELKNLEERSIKDANSFADSFAELLCNYGIVVPGPIPLEIELDLLNDDDFVKYKGGWMLAELYYLTTHYQYYDLCWLYW